MRSGAFACGAAVAAAVAGGVSAAAPAAASEQIVVLEFPERLGGPVALDFGFFGVDAVGCDIVETRIVVTFRPDAGIDAADLYSGFDVPVILSDPSGSTRIELIGSELGWSGQGVFEYSEITTDYNGVVRAGRFGWELRAVEFGDPMSGDFLENSRLEFVVRCPCDADCDGSGELDFFDFLCFQDLFAAGDPEADCDGSGGLDFFDFLCFQEAFAAGCS